MLVFAFLLHLATANAAVVVMRNGMVLEGQLGYIASIDVNPLVTQDPAGQVEQIALIDDGLRRTYVSSHQVESLGESDPTGKERIRIRQNVAKGKRQIGAVTAIRSIGKFNQYGRRIFSIVTPRGPVDIFQGITEITPVYTRVQGLVGRPSIRWDSRIATSSIPRQTLSKVMRLQGMETGADAQMSVVRLLFEAQRYNDARIELESAMREFPELEELKGLLVQLKQYTGRRLVDEIELRQQAGQHRRARALLANFPEQGIATETLQRVSQLLRDYQRLDQEVEQFKTKLAAMAGDVRDPVLKPQVAAVANEIEGHLSYNTLSRLQDFQRLADDPQLTLDTRLSLLISGWILGSGSATQNLSEALSLVRTRDLVMRYLATDREEERVEILQLLGREEGGTPQHLVEMLEQLDPPWITEPQPNRPPGNYVIEVPGVPSGTFSYEVQLPDEYDPHRRYPAIVTLHAAGRTVGQQIDWWAGAFDSQRQARLGQATRRGYIVIAPNWIPPGRRAYEYSGREHAAVLSCLRDAGRRFSIDTDQVFLSGHSVGGDAAWDIGLAHPDLWAGVIPIVAVGDYGPQAPKYVAQYWENARNLSLYFVMGELDGNKLELNRRDLDRYLRRPQIDVMINEYIGRGHEHFYDEIHRIFDWMALHRREFHLDKYECVSMRPFDNFFYNLELESMPARSMVGPYEWPTKSATRPARASFEETAIGSLRIQTGAVRAALWLSPRTVELNERLRITVNGKSRQYSVAPDVKTVLEDARTRVDRKHPFWARVELVTGER